MITQAEIVLVKGALLLASAGGSSELFGSAQTLDPSKVMVRLPLPVGARVDSACRCFKNPTLKLYPKSVDAKGVC